MHFLLRPVAADPPSTLSEQMQQLSHKRQHSTSPALARKRHCTDGAAAIDSPNDGQTSKTNGSSTTRGRNRKRRRNKQSNTVQQFTHPVELLPTAGTQAEWYPTWLAVAERAATAVRDPVVQHERRKRLTDPNEMSWPLPAVQAQKGIGGEKLWRVLPVTALVRAENQRNVARMFAFALAGLPYWRTHVLTEDPSSPWANGLHAQDWKSLATCHGLDAFQSVEVTRGVLRCMGMKDIANNVAGNRVHIVNDGSSVHQTQRIPISVYDEEDDLDYGESLRIKEYEWDDAYFDHSVSGAFESERYRYEPTGYRMIAKNRPRPRSDYTWFRRGDYGTHGTSLGAMKFDDPTIIEWRMIVSPKGQAFEEELSASDVWTIPEKGWVLLLPTYGSPQKASASGEHLLRPSVFYTVPKMNNNHIGAKKWLGTVTNLQGEVERKVYTELRAWHNHVTNQL
jgi:hypothetical protein